MQQRAGEQVLGQIGAGDVTVALAFGQGTSCPLVAAL